MNTNKFKSIMHAGHTLNIASTNEAQGVKYSWDVYEIVAYQMLMSN